MPPPVPLDGPAPVSARVRSQSDEWVVRTSNGPLLFAADEWNALLASQAEPSPFMRHEYLDALHQSGSATAETGWRPCFVTLQRGPDEDAPLLGVCPLYIKAHSYGEYVFDWAWANAYAEHGLAYYPKAVVAVPYTPVPGARLLAVDDEARAALVRGVIAVCQAQGLSSAHLLFGAETDVVACTAAGMLLRHTVQFHWTNPAPRFASFEAFLTSLSHDKRKKIRQERRKVRDAGVAFRWARGNSISAEDWDFFYTCYERTYLEHGNAPYLTRDFFHRMALDMPEAWLMFVGERQGRPIATSLIAIGASATSANGQFDAEAPPEIAYGRYWGALERIDCLHFEACYYQPLEWCIAHGVARFEGGAQGEHKMARALMPVKTTSAHWLAHPAFADAVERFLEREGGGIENYLQHLDSRTPFRQTEEAAE